MTPTRTVAASLPAVTLRKALLAGVAAAALLVAAMPAEAQPSDGIAFPRYIVRTPVSTARPPVKSASRSVPKPAVKEEAPKGQLQIVVSIANQHVTLYADGSRVAQGPVSTGIPGKPTPTGLFSIIQKDRYHHSNLYSNAPMPFMERITWSGVALHEGPLPGYPASHGCIRMTHEFALRLWGITKLGVRVIVAHNEVVPVPFSHPSLFTPKAKPADSPVADDQPEKHADVATPIRIAQAAGHNSADAPDAATTGAAAAEALRGAVGSGNSTGSDTTAPPPAATAVTAPPVVQAAPAAEDPAKPSADVEDPLRIAPPKGRAVEQAVKHGGHLAVFISRREKRLYVRQDFVPLFDVPVEIQNPEQPFGTHVLTALAFTDDGAGMRWNLMSMAGGPARPLSTKIGKKGQPTAPARETFAPQTAAQVLDRIQIPQEARDRIDELLVPGSSLVVSDQGLGGETGQGTDFIVLAR